MSAKPRFDLAGEPENYFEGHGDYGFEDGTLAREILAKHGVKK